jgi:hypothetical protein
VAHQILLDTGEGNLGGVDALQDGAFPKVASTLHHCPDSCTLHESPEAKRSSSNEYPIAEMVAQSKLGTPCLAVSLLMRLSQRISKFIMTIDDDWNRTAFGAPKLFIEMIVVIGF